ncbi:hypothetical protein LCGC14_0597130 [marine sediment metagenome]|uniref:Uncharacterized protein n=1 Tax=marine sediment metagenome TaxID=412755 RepID=A0A0F9RBP7_9ZZZZ
MVKILKDKDRKEKEKVHKELDGIDSTLLDINHKFRQLKNEFNLKRDRDLVQQIRNRLQWCANKTLLLKGRILRDLGSRIFIFGQDYLQFRIRRLKTSPRNLKYIPLIATNYSGKKFSNFMKREFDAKARVIIEGNKMVILSILIPKGKKNLIVYK